MNEPKFLIVVTGYNCEQYVERCMVSIENQSYKNYVVSAIDDGSTDNTVNLIYQNTDQTFDMLFCAGGVNRGTYFARNEAIRVPFLDNDHYDIIALLDMDDALLPNALEMAAKEYEIGMWMTYGNYQFENGNKNPLPIHYSDEIHANRDYRKDVFRCTHLRTFKRELYEMIPTWYLTQSEINSYPDAEILFSMMEMCGKDRIGVINDPIYIYNNSNPISTLNRFGKDHKGYEEICNRPKRNLI